MNMIWEGYVFHEYDFLKLLLYEYNHTQKSEYLYNLYDVMNETSGYDLSLKNTTVIELVPKHDVSHRGLTAELYLDLMNTV